MAECRPPYSCSFSPSPRTNRFPRVLSTEFSGRWVRVTVSPRPMCVSTLTHTHTHTQCSLPTPLGNSELSPGLVGPADPESKNYREVGLTENPEKSGKSHTAAVFSVGRRVFAHTGTTQKKCRSCPCSSKNNSNSQLRKRALSLRTGPLPLPPIPTSQTPPQSYPPPLSRPQQATREIRDSWAKT